MKLKIFPQVVWQGGSLLFSASVALAQLPCVAPQYLGGFVSAPHSPGDLSLHEDRPVQGPDGALYFTLREGGAHYNGAIVKVTLSGEMSTVYDFEGTAAPARGSRPAGGLTFGADGNLYGHTSGGGSDARGTLYRCTLAGGMTVLHSFTGTSSSPAPVGALLQASDGNFYGMTMSGGVVHTAGTIFRLTTSGAFTELLAFTGADAVDAPGEGARPRGSLVERNEGGTAWVYGVLESSGANGYGKVFRFALPAVAAGTVTPQTVGRFTGDSGPARGRTPHSGLTKAADGTLYGTASGGGVNGYGTLYKIPAGGGLSAVFDFGADLALAGGEPFSAPVQGTDGYLYGTVSRNGGGVYRVSTAGTGASVLSGYVPGGAMGQGPISVMQTADGDVWGLSVQGGPRERGVLFRLRGNGAARSLSQMVHFGLRTDSLEGAYPTGGLVSAGALLYGTTEEGGSGLNNGRGYGTIFSLTPSGTRTTLITFTGTGAFPGIWPKAALLRSGDGALYGTTSAGGTDGKGTLFRYQPADASFTSMAQFTGTTASAGGAKGESPSGVLTDGNDGWIYGTTRYGGAAGAGTVFRFPKAGGAVVTLVEFTGTSGTTPGGEPLCGLTPAYAGPFQPALAFYGVTSRGGAADRGTLFRVTPTGTISTLVQFTGGSGLFPGSSPQGQLVWKDGALYGTARSEGLSGYGTIFRYLPDAGPFSIVASLGSSNAAAWHGRSPLAGLTMASDGHLYGTTSSGTAEAGNGTLFRLEANDTLTPISNFGGLDLASLLPGRTPPLASLCAAEDGDLYGITYEGGPGNGTVFKVALGAKLGTLDAVNMGNGIVRLRGSVIPAGGTVQLGFEVTPAEEVGFEPYTYYAAGSSSTAREFTYDAAGFTRGVTYLIRSLLDGPCGRVTAGWVEYTADTVYASWKVQHFGANASVPAIAGDAADPDRDGVPDLVEFLTGTDPQSPTPAPLTAALTNVGAQRFLTFRYFRRENADAGETLSVQTSTDLVTWQSLAAAGGSEQRSAGPVSGSELFVYQYEGSVPVTAGRRYLRLKATRP